MENNQNYTELEIIRSQMAQFKEQLDKQKIVNEKLIIKSMKSSMSWIKKFVYIEICALPLIAIAWLGIKMYANLSWLNYGFLMTVLVIDIFADYRINISALSDADYSRNNLVTTITKLTRMKRLRVIQMMFEIPAIVVWLVWSSIEALTHLPAEAFEFEQNSIYAGIVGGIIGAIGGIVLAYRIFSKMQRSNDEVIRQINELNA